MNTNHNPYQRVKSWISNSYLPSGLNLSFIYFFVIKMVGHWILQVMLSTIKDESAKAQHLLWPENNPYVRLTSFANNQENACQPTKKLISR